jgi:hypothetical protein
LVVVFGGLLYPGRVLVPELVVDGGKSARSSKKKMHGTRELVVVRIGSYALAGATDGEVVSAVPVDVSGCNRCSEGIRWFRHVGDPGRFLMPDLVAAAPQPTGRPIDDVNLARIHCLRSLWTDVLVRRSHCKVRMSVAVEVSDGEAGRAGRAGRVCRWGHRDHQ